MADDGRLAHLTVTRGAIIIASFSVLSRLVGVVRDRLLAHTFGAGSVLDAYYAAFKVPDFIFNTIVLGAVASAFIPVFVRLQKSEPCQAERLTQTLFTGLTLSLILWAVLGAILAPQLMAIVAPGFDVERQVLAVKLTRFMLLAMVFFGASNVVGSVLQAQRRFLAFAAAPVAYNVGIVVGIVWLVPIIGTSALAWGVVLGSLLHLSVQLPTLRKTGLRLGLCFAFADSAVRQVGRLLVPRTLGLAAAQLNQLVTASFISRLSVGSLAAFTFATNLQSFPTSVIGVSLAVAAFPIFSAALGDGKPTDFVAHFSHSVRRILFFVLPLAILFLVLRAQIVRVVLGSGAFDWGDTLRTAQALGFLSLALVSDSLVPLVARAFYALRDTRTPVIISLISIAVNLALLIVLRPFGLAGVGMAYVVASACNLTFLLIALGRRLTTLGADDIMRGAWHMLLAAVLAGAAAYGALRIVAPLVNMRTFVGIFGQGLIAGLVGLASYICLTLMYHLPEAAFVRRWLSAAWRLVTRWNRV